MVTINLHKDNRVKLTMKMTTTNTLPTTVTKSIELCLMLILKTTKGISELRKTHKL
jgi:hypothetical protein